jgi:glutamyl/glutaminyl-tRNA synthetase
MEKTFLYNKTRLAPTPSGFLHLGNVLSFSLTAALARRTGAKILLRIDDLDKSRVGSEYVQDIFDTLDFLEIPWDEGPRNFLEYEREFSQQHRLELYRAALQQLLEDGKLFACSCSRTSLSRESSDGGYPGTCRDKRIPFDTADTSWRLLTEGAGEIAVKTVVGAGGGRGLAGRGLAGETGRAPLTAELRDFIVKKKDGFPAYQLVSVMDDLYFGVDLVVRGEDLWPSTLAQHWLARQLQRDAFGEIHFYHHPLLVEPDGTKLSKSAGGRHRAASASIRDLRGQGHTAPAIYSMIARMMGMDFRPASWEELAAGWDGEKRVSR